MTVLQIFFHLVAAPTEKEIGRQIVMCKLAHVIGPPNRADNYKLVRVNQPLAYTLNKDLTIESLFDCLCRPSRDQWKTICLNLGTGMTLLVWLLSFIYLLIILTREERSKNYKRRFNLFNLHSSL